MLKIIIKNLNIRIIDKKIRKEYLRNKWQTFLWTRKE